MTLQIRSCGYHDTDQWSDLKPGVNYLSGKYEIREKPAFEPGWYYLAHTGEHLEFRFCRNHEPTHFPGDWHLVTEEKLERVFGYDVEEGWDD